VIYIAPKSLTKISTLGGQYRLTEGYGWVFNKLSSASVHNSMQ